MWLVFSDVCACYFLHRWLLWFWGNILNKLYQIMIRYELCSQMCRHFRCVQATMMVTTTQANRLQRGLCWVKKQGLKTKRWKRSRQWPKGYGVFQHGIVSFVCFIGYMTGSYAVSEIYTIKVVLKFEVHCMRQISSQSKFISRSTPNISFLHAQASYTHSPTSIMYTCRDTLDLLLSMRCNNSDQSYRPRQLSSYDHVG